MHSGSNFYYKVFYHCFIQVQNNGIISLSLRHSPEHFIKDPFPLEDFILIAPFYGDVDTRSGGETWYTKPVSTNNTTLERAKEDIKPIYSGCYDTFSLKYVVTATWYQVGYFKEQTDKARFISHCRCTVLVILIIYIVLYYQCFYSFILFSLCS